MIPAAYYRSLLSAEEQAVYRTVTSELLKHRSLIRLFSPSLDANALARVVRAIHLDHPELFFVNFWEGVSIATSLLTGTELRFRFLLDGEPSRCVSESLRQNYLRLREKLRPLPSAEQKYALLIREITGSTRYEDSGSAFWDHTAAGPLLRHTAVCEGLAKLFLYDCQCLGLPCALVTGSLRGVPHAWNMIEPGPSRLYVDLTGLLLLPAPVLFPALLFRTADELRRSGYEFDLD